MILDTCPPDRVPTRDATTFQAAGRSQNVVVTCPPDRVPLVGARIIHPGSCCFDLCLLFEAQGFDGVLAQDELLYLATGGHREGIDKLEVARRLLMADLVFAERT